MLATNIERIGTIAVIDLDTRDLLGANLIRTLSRELSQTAITQTVINLEQITALSSGEWAQIVALTDALKLLGINSVICGIHPAVAMTLTELVQPVKIGTYLDVDGALHAFKADR